jgi:hypothetical protein
MWLVDTASSAAHLCCSEAPLRQLLQLVPTPHKVLHRTQRYNQSINQSINQSTNQSTQAFNQSTLHL